MARLMALDAAAGAASTTTTRSSQRHATAAIAPRHDTKTAYRPPRADTVRAVVDAMRSPGQSPDRANSGGGGGEEKKLAGLTRRGVLGVPGGAGLAGAAR